MPRYLGIDQSLTSTGVCILDADLKTKEYKVIYAAVIQTKPSGKVGEHDTVERARSIASEIIRLVGLHNVHYMAMEGLSFASGGNSTRNLAMLFGILLEKLGSNVEVVTPSALKKYATGNGRATKDMMLNAIKDQYPAMHQMLTETPKSKGKYDMADAFWIAHYKMEQ